MNAQANLNIEVFVDDLGRPINHSSLPRQDSVHVYFKNEIIAKLQQLP